MLTVGKSGNSDVLFLLPAVVNYRMSEDCDARDHCLPLPCIFWASYSI